MALLNKTSNDLIGTASHLRRWLFGIIIFCALLGIAISANIHWRMPLTSTLLHKALERAGLPQATLTVDAFSASQLRLTDIHLSSELTIKRAEIHFDYVRLPGNPITTITLSKIRGGLTSNEKTIRRLLKTPDKDSTSALFPTPESIRALLKRVPTMPSIALEDIMLRVAASGPVTAVTGSIDGGPKNNDAYSARFKTKISGTLAGKKCSLSLDGSAHIAPETLTTKINAQTSDGVVSKTLTGRLVILADQLRMDGDVSLRVKKLVSTLATINEIKLNGAFRLLKKTMPSRSLFLKPCRLATPSYTYHRAMKNRHVYSTLNHLIYS